MARHDIEVAANAIFELLVGAENATLPVINLFDELHSIPWDEEHAVYKPVEKINAALITEKKVNGNGIFDTFMSAFDVHLQREFQAGRITGAEYSKVYTTLSQAAMAHAVQFALGQDAAFWAAAKAQAEAITARTNNEIARLQAMLARANYALTKAKLSTEDSAYGNSEYQVANILPAQKELLDEQKEAQRAQTMNTRSDGVTVVAGLLGTQKSLYSQQITSYKEDVKVKAAKVFMDAWITQLTIDDATPPSKYFAPSNFGPDAEHALDDIFRELRLSAIDDGTNNMP